MTSEAPDRSGYSVTPQGGGAVAATWAVTRLSDGVGLGAYITDAEVDAAISADRAELAAAADAHVHA